jgi:hypothetical protein
MALPNARLGRAEKKADKLAEAALRKQLNRFLSMYRTVCRGRASDSDYTEVLGVLVDIVKNDVYRGEIEEMSSSAVKEYLSTRAPQPPEALINDVLKSLKLEDS